MRGVLDGATNNDPPKRPDVRLVVSNRIALKNPLSAKIDTTTKVAAGGKVLVPVCASCTKTIHRTTLKGMILKKYTSGYLP